ncbi:DUF6386 family protein [Pseudomonas abietaniphila]|uniref:DUF6386 family protein n=1 Tax=Pseudomonas abietaniphila TaxID=89065 RepID=UPI00078287E8|nr:DUF6386 family protein [Pseudomonas abietaniphila]
MSRKFSVITDTATIVVFDLAAIKHRISDAPDWWSIQQDEVHEVNKGNIAFLNVGEDGVYNIKIVDDVSDEDGRVYIGFPSGHIFIGAGEDTAGGDLEPDGSDAIQGEMLKFTPGNYKLKYKNIGNYIVLSFSPSEINYNSIVEPIRI